VGDTIRLRKNEREAVLVVIVFTSFRALLAILLHFPVLISLTLRSVNVIRIQPFVFLLLFLRKFLPIMTLFGTEALPLLTDGLGQVSLSLLPSTIEGIFSSYSSSFFAAFPTK